MDNNTTENVKRIISDNRNNIAFIIGNGINKYAGINQANGEKPLSWEELLKEIGDDEFKDFVEDKDGKVKQGISYTEIYDAIESHNRKKRMEQEKWDEILELISKEVPEIKPIGRRRNTRIDETKRKIKKLVDEHKTSKPCRFTDYEKHSIHEICYDLGIDVNLFMRTRDDDDGDVYYRLKRLNQKLSNGYFSVLLSNELKDKVCNKMGEWMLDDKVSNMLTFIHEMDAPILTTNFDLSISRKLDKLFPKQMEYQVMEKGMRSEVFPWSYYYGYKSLNDSCSRFGIWHMHGIASKPQSLCLGLSDYMRITEKAWGKIHKDDFFETDMFGGKNNNYWDGYRTWLHIFFNKSLFIMGLTLEENETFLRWLLIQRAKYFALFPDRKYKGWYVYPKEEEKQTNFFGKKVFLEKVGFEMLPVDSYKVIYEDLWN